MEPPTQQDPSRALAATLALLAVAWIIGAHFFRHEGDSDPASVQLALSAMGLWFVACGVWTYLRRPTPLSLCFLGYCALSGIHWGGPIGVGASRLQSVELAFFIVGATVLTQAVFIDLARRLKSDGEQSPFWPLAPYAPFFLGCALFAIFVFQPDNEAMLSSFALFYVVGVLLSLVGGVILVVRPFQTSKRRFANGVVAAALIAGWTPHALVAGGLVAAGGLEGLYSLPLAAIPLALAWRVDLAARHPAV